jgi:cell wall-associated protease
MKRKFVRFMVVLLISVLFFSQLPLKEIKANEANVPKEEETLILSTPVEDVFESSEQTHWYKIDPTKSEIEDFTHLRMKLQSEKELIITVFSSLENAIDNRAFERYMGYSYTNAPAIIDFPIAWVGPYYIKIESYVDEYSEGEIEDTVTPYTISYDGITLPPSNLVMVEECPAELSTKQRENGKSILKDLRTIREDVLAKTEKGKDLSAMYYKIAPFVSSKMVFSKTLRDNVYNDLMQLKGLFTNVAINGSSSTYKITQEDQKSINNLYATALESVPNFLKDEIEKTGKSIDISNLTNKTVSSILTKGGLTKTNVNSNENRLLVKMKNGAKLSNLQAKTEAIGIQSIAPLGMKGSVFPNMFVMEVEDNSSSLNVSSNSLKAASVKISNLPEVEFVEPVQQYHALSADSQYPYQWSLKNDGSGHGIADADIQFEKLQELLKGNPLNETVIAVVDTGVDYTLADLSGSVLADDGYNFINNSSNAMDDNGHGTHVSGIIAAEGNNQFSMSGINSHAKILPVKVLDESGGGDTEQIAYGIKYAVDKGANVINLSLGGSYSRVLEYALKYANDRGVTIVAATGNDGSPGIFYPASSKYAISVGSTNRLDIVSDYSNYGKGIDLVAPGTEIPSLMPDGNVTYMSGTSMATPHVAAVAGILLARNPDLLPSEVEKILTKTAHDVIFDEQDNPGNGEYPYPGEYPEYPEYPGENPYPVEQPVPGYDNVSGWGRLDAYSAVSSLDIKEATMERIFGSSRYETAVNVSIKGWVQSDVAVIATGRNYPDALSATPLAYKNKAPLLLTNTNALPASVKAELTRLKVKKVILIGGVSAITSNVEKDINALGITNISRIKGSDRYETSVNIAKQLGSANRAVVVTGESFVDALSIAPIAASLNMPILLTKKNAIPDSVSQYVKSSKFKQTFVIGGPSVIPNKIANGFPNHKRISGSTRYETNSSIINYFAGELDMSSSFIATGSNYPDALSGSALAAVQGNPMILTNPSVVQQTTKDTISKYADKAEKYYIIGGEKALPKSLIDSLFE